MSTSHSPSQAAPRTMLALNKRLLVSLGLSTESANIVSDRIAELEKELTAATQLAETNGKALADKVAHYSKLADEHANQADLLNMQLAQSQADLLAWKGNCERMCDQHGELSKELAQSQAREASLAAALDSARTQLMSHGHAEEIISTALSVTDAALARHQAAVDSAAVEEKTP